MSDFKIGEIVWTKLRGHPWWPSRVYIYIIILNILKYYYNYITNYKYLFYLITLFYFFIFYIIFYFILFYFILFYFYLYYVSFLLFLFFYF